jgi:hypothetical protein
MMFIWDDDRGEYWDGEGTWAVGAGMGLTV